jgi:PDZ domain-containing secreted protein/Zn-dependent protease/CBS domain-containing protein
MESSFTFLRVRGIEIGAHWTWLFVFALVVWSLGSQLFPRTYPGLSPWSYWVMAAFASILFFGSVLLHELGHALTALREGVRIEGITLWLFGGVARFSTMFKSAGGEFVIAAAGPGVSLVLTVVFFALTWLANLASFPSPVRGVLDYVARINLIVLLFNLLPALPLDGGRVFRAWLWRRQGSFEAATQTAARAGQLFGILLIGVGLLGFFSGSSAGGLWIAFIGWFLFQAAQGEAVFARVRGAFQGLRVRDVMTPDPQVLSPAATVEELLERAAEPRTPSSYPVVDEGALVGFVSLRQAARVPAELRGRTPVSEVMLPRDQVPTISPDEEVESVLPTVQGAGRAVVVQGDRVVGILSMSDLARLVERRTLREEVAGPRARPAGILPWAVVLLAAILLVGLLYHPPVVQLTPGPTLDVTRDITIGGIRTDDVNGSYLLTSVQLTRPTALGALIAFLRPDRDLASLSAVFPSGVDQGDVLRQQQRLFEESRRVAAAAAARAAGMGVSIQGRGAAVVDVVPASPAAGVLRPGDVIVAVDGRRIRLASDLGEEIRSRPEGTEFELRIKRGGSRRTETVRSARIPVESEEFVGIGVVVETRGLSVDLPFTIEFRSRDIGGPSAGAAYAMAIADLLERADFARGRTIAVTGTVDLEGDIGPVDGVAAKAEGAEEAGADLFLVPAGQVDEATGQGVPVRGVPTLEEALELLRQTA